MENILQNMKIGVVGLWHLGEVYSACLAELGHHVVAVDENIKVIHNLNKGIAPLQEPGLERMLNRNIKKGRLKYTTDYKLLSACEILWCTVDTPIDKHNQADTGKIFACIKKSLPHLQNGVLIVVSSQVPAGTYLKLSKYIKEYRKNFTPNPECSACKNENQWYKPRGQLSQCPKCKLVGTGFTFDYAYVPENLRLGEAIDSFMKPSRIVIGINNNNRRNDLFGIFKKLKITPLTVSVASAEMIKHATNAYLATSLSFIYDIADVCEKVGADVIEVSRALRADARIGEKAYLDASAGFSGGHLERDLEYLQKIAQIKKIALPVIASVIRKNKERKKIVFNKIAPLLGTFKGKTITFYGLTYKSGTPALNHSLPIMVAKETQLLGAKINLCDPRVNKNDITNEMRAGSFNYFADPHESVKGSQAIICITPWAHLKKLDFGKIARLMKHPKIFFDARNYFVQEQNTIEKAGIKYMGVGR